jgi:acyl-CoA reductase-like NAD-dependent aldehyde dehydrogenase
MNEPTTWSNRNPGDLDDVLPEVAAGDVAAAVDRARAAFPAWRDAGLEARKDALRAARERLAARQEDLARAIAREMGKPVREARLELGAVLAKFDLSFADAERFVAESAVTDGPHPAAVRRRPRGVAAVIAPYNFPIHLGHGAAVGYLLAGNPVVFKPSPLAAWTGQLYAAEMQAALPDGVFSLVQGWGETGRALCVHPDVRAVCFTGSVPVGRAIARAVAEDYAKSVALELGGKNCLIVCADADLDHAATAAADGLCLTTGQRCNATSRILVDASVADAFCEKLVTSLERFLPGNPLDEGTLLGPLATASAAERFARLLERTDGSWVQRGAVCPEVDGRRGHYVIPAVLRVDDTVRPTDEETFAPFATVEVFSTPEEAVARQGWTRFGLTASIFTRSPETFRRLGDRLEVGNLYANLPTTFSPSTLPFGGLGDSGNGKPGGRGFVRFAGEEQAVQWTGFPTES